MRIRSTKPEFWRSKTIAALPWDVRLVLKGLESYVDDNGVGKDDIALIAADVFPRDLSGNPRETLARLSEAVSLLSEHGLIARYEHDGEELLYIDRWKDLQRIDKPAKGRFRRPDGTLDYSEEVSRESYRNPRDTLASPPERVAPVTGEQGNRGTGEQGQPVLASSPQVTSARGGVQHLGPEQKTALRIATAWEQSFENRPAQSHINDVTAEIQKLVNEGIPEAQISAGLNAWMESTSFAPSMIATHVAKASRPKLATGTNRAMAGIELARQFAQEEEITDEPF